MDSISAEGERPVAGEEQHPTSAAAVAGATVPAAALEGTEDDTGGDNSTESSAAKDSSSSASSSDWSSNDGLSSIVTSPYASSLPAEQADRQADAREHPRPVAELYSSAHPLFVPVDGRLDGPDHEMKASVGSGITAGSEWRVDLQ